MNATGIPLYVTLASAWTISAVTVAPVQLVLTDLTVKRVSTYNGLIFSQIESDILCSPFNK